MAEIDPIRKLFEETGWSYSEILKKLELYNKEPSESTSQLSESSDTADPKNINTNYTFDKNEKSEAEEVDKVDELGNIEDSASSVQLEAQNSVNNTCDMVELERNQATVNTVITNQNQKQAALSNNDPENTVKGNNLAKHHVNVNNRIRTTNNREEKQTEFRKKNITAMLGEKLSLKSCREENINDKSSIINYEEVNGVIAKCSNNDTNGEKNNRTLFSDGVSTQNQQHNVTILSSHKIVNNKIIDLNQSQAGRLYMKEITDEKSLIKYSGERKETKKIRDARKRMQENYSVPSKIEEIEVEIIEAEQDDNNEIELTNSEISNETCINIDIESGTESKPDDKEPNTEPGLVQFDSNQIIIIDGETTSNSHGIKTKEQMDNMKETGENKTTEMYNDFRKPLSPGPSRQAKHTKRKTKHLQKEPCINSVKGVALLPSSQTVLGNTRLRILRKYRPLLLNRRPKKIENRCETSTNEEIRSKLKEQLGLLRRKRTTQEPPATSKQTTAIKHHYDIRRLNNITSSLFQKLHNDTSQPPINKCLESEVSTSSKEVLSGDTEHVTLSNETDLMIVSVIGGYKSPSPEPIIELNKENEELTVAIDDNCIKPTKTTDVTKIKGWKNKKFAPSVKPSEKIYSKLLSDCDPSEKPETSFKHTPEPPATPSDKPVEEIRPQSAFVSDELDQFLTENSRLNISYEVPKLEAEQTITTKYIDIEFPQLNSTTRPSTVNKTKDEYKPKTLAEKRRMLADHNKSKIKAFMSTLNDEQRKNYEQKVLGMRLKLIEENVPFTRRCFVTSTSITDTHCFVVYNGKKLKVPSCHSEKQIITTIDEKKKTRHSYLKRGTVRAVSHRKPSLLDDLKMDKEQEPYDPKQWQTVRMKLPKLILELKPELGRPIHPKIEHLIVSNGVTLTPGKVAFALSALQFKNTPPSKSIFKFPLNHLNSRKFINMKKRIEEKLNGPESDDAIKEIVDGVMEKMLHYVETIEATKDVIQEESDVELPESCQKTNSTSPNEIVSVSKKQKALPAQRSCRTTLEMKRLNCKIVSISMEDETRETELCTKEFCKLGCICKSIECNTSNTLPTHCGLLKCMFNCTCSFKNPSAAGQRISMPAGTNIFSEGIINRLKDEAKKNLAKVEKEFTQTVIRTNNQLIMVEDSNGRRRRTTKIPKKYIDYVDDLPEKPVSKNIPFDDTPHYTPVLTESPKNKTFQSVLNKTTSNSNYNIFPATKPCHVPLVNHNFNAIMPFCLVHLLYKCPCKNMAVFKDNVPDKEIIGCTYVSCPTSSKTKTKPPSPPPPPLLPINKKIKRPADRTFCSRTRGLITSYYLYRNKSAQHKEKLKKSSRKLQKKLESYLIEYAQQITDTPEKNASSIELEYVSEQSESRTSSKRKQSFVVLEDQEACSSPKLKKCSEEPQVGERKLQRRKLKNTRITPPATTAVTKSILQDTKTIEPKIIKSKMLRSLSNTGVQLRLLPWSTLATRYENRTFQIWFSNTSNRCPLIITENGKRPSHLHYNIKLYENMPEDFKTPSDTIHCLVRKVVPMGKPVANILVVISLNTRNYWNICGVCEKNQQPESKEQVSISLIGEWTDPEFNADSTEELPVIDLDNYQVNENANTISQKRASENLLDSKKVMYCNKRSYQQRMLICDVSPELDSQFREILWAPIPSVGKQCKWRVINMDVSFAYLSLSRSNYTIKYEDIKRVMKIAGDNRTTIALKSEELQAKYPHRAFGIYCVDNYLDNIFVGPYYIQEDHDLDILIFVNNVLVNTHMFDQMNGKKVPSSGCWFREAAEIDAKPVDDDVVIVNNPCPTVDLTCDSDEDPLDITDRLQTKTPNVSQQDVYEITSDRSTTPDQDTERTENTSDSVLETIQSHSIRAFELIETGNESTSSMSSVTTAVGSSTSTITEIERPKRDRDIESNNDDSSDSENNLVIDEDIDVELVPTDANASKEGKVVDESSTGDDFIQNIDNVRYLMVRNVPNLGYILAYQDESTHMVDVTCPITKKKKRFNKMESAITSLERVLSKRFILVPAAFKLDIRMFDRVETSVFPLERSFLNGYHIVGEFGIKNILYTTCEELKQLNFGPKEINRIMFQREKKLFWGPLTELGQLLYIPIKEHEFSNSLQQILDRTVQEIKKLQKDNENFIKEKIDLELSKVSRAQQCSTLVSELPIRIRMKVQQNLDKIINFSSNKEQPTTKINDNLKTSDGKFDDSTRTKLPSTTILNNKRIKTINCKLRPVGGTSLLTGKKVEMSNQAGSRSLLSPLALSLSSGQKDKYVIMNKNGNISGTLQQCITKRVPIQVRKDMMEASNNALKLQQLITNGQLRKVLTKVPALPQRRVLQTIAPKPMPKLLPDASAAHVTNKSKIATLTEMLHSKFATEKNVPATSLKENDNLMRYFQIIPDSQTTLKRSSTNMVTQPPVKELT